MIYIFRRGRVYWIRGSFYGHTIQRRSLDTTDKRTAELIKRDFERHVLEDSEPVLWNTLSQEFDKFLDSSSLSHNTKVKYRFILRKFGAFLESRGIAVLQAISRETIEAYIEARKLQEHPTKGNAVGPEGIKSDLRILRRIFSYAVAKGYARENPVKFDRLNTRARGTLPFSHDEISRMLVDRGFNARPDNRAILLTFLYTGLRISDIINMKKDVVDMASGQMRIPVKKKGGAILHLAAHPELLAALKDHIKALKGRQAKSPYMFPTKSGKPTVNMDSILRSLWKRCGIENGHAHRFRDTFAVNLLAKGASLYDVAKLLGNTEAVTARHYAPYVRELQERGKALVASLDFNFSTTGAQCHFLSSQVIENKARG